MGRFLLTRLGLAAITLFLLSVLVFVGANLLPGDVARRKLGNTASQASVDQLNHQLGTDKPILVQYWNWISGLLHGDLGTSLSYRLPVSELIGPALLHSLKLAALAFVMVVPLAIVGGVIAALKRDRLTDRVITVGGLSLAVVPEFVTGIMLILVFGLWLDLFPVSANAPDGSNILTQLKYLFLPALTLVIVLFGYISTDHPRRHDRGARRRLHTNRDAQGSAAAHGHPPPRPAQLAPADDRRHRDSDRLSDRRTRRHRDTLQLSGDGPAHLHRGQRQGLSRSSQAASSSSASSFSSRPCLPTSPTRCSTRVSATPPPNDDARRPSRADRDPDSPGRDQGGASRTPPPARSIADVPARLLPRRHLGRLRDLRQSDRAARPCGARHPQQVRGTLGCTPLRNRQARPGRPLARHRRRTLGTRGRATRDHSRNGAGYDDRPRDRVLPGLRGRGHHARRRRHPRHPSDHHRAARDHGRGTLAEDAHPRDRLRLHADHRQDGARSRPRRGAARVRAGRAPPQRARPVRDVRRDPAQRDGADHRRVHRPARLCHLHRRNARVPRLRRRPHYSRLGPGHLGPLPEHQRAATGGRCSSPRSPSRRSSSAST